MIWKNRKNPFYNQKWKGKEMEYKQPREFSAYTFRMNLAARVKW